MSYTATQDNSKFRKNKTAEKHENNPFVLLSTSKLKTLLKSTEPPFMSARVSLITKTKDT